ncbi:hypothetical protein NDU88_006305 [Pleurodeles waltl]|uniref:Uncharacterized protein n=1 Tax=Pleurodeles waltl TaxID=8319 RepID=A0AAV7N897_PLEWA|nr:hypothetical protein NDU88_006305 [Pleurodeles waltl]
MPGSPRGKCKRFRQHQGEEPHTGSKSRLRPEQHAENSKDGRNVRKQLCFSAGLHKPVGDISNVIINLADIQINPMRCDAMDRYRA